MFQGISSHTQLYGVVMKHGYQTLSKHIFQRNFEVGLLDFTLFRDLSSNAIEFLDEEVFANLRKLKYL